MHILHRVNFGVKLVVDVVVNAVITSLRELFDRERAVYEELGQLSLNLVCEAEFRAC